jgi:transposase
MARDRTIHNDVVSDVASSARVRRGEVLIGVERRRKWSDEMRIAIVAEALEPGVVVSQVARRHDLNPSQLFGWLKHYRAEVMALRSAKLAASAPAFVPAMLDVTDVATTPQVPIIAAGATVSTAAPGLIEISIAAMTIRVHGAADAKTIALVLKALRALA